MPPLIIVTGLPRSGTSLLMAMLGAAGIPLVDDGQRQADADNPRGYWEDARTKALARDASWLAGTAGSALKITIPLIRSVPPDIPAASLWIERDLGEVISSQTAMLQRQGLAAALPPARLGVLFEQQIAETRRHLAAIPSFRVLTLHHSSLLADPSGAASAVAEFLALPASAVTAMAACVDPALYRQRK